MNFQETVKNIINKILQGKNPKFNIKGQPNIVKQFGKTIQAEVKLIKLQADYGPEAPIVQRNKKELEVEIKKFERISGISWPIK